MPIRWLHLIKSSSTIRVNHAPIEVNIGEEKENSDDNYYYHDNDYGEDVGLMNCPIESWPYLNINNSNTKIRPTSHVHGKARDKTSCNPPNHPDQCATNTNHKEGCTSKSDLEQQKITKLNYEKSELSNWFAYNVKLKDCKKTFVHLTTIVVLPW